MGGNIPSKLEEYEQDLSYIDINRVQMKMFYKAFCKMATVKDQDYVTVSEILKYANVPYSHFAARALCCGFCYVSATESEDSERKILANYRFDFGNFVFTLWNFLTLCPKVFITFIFSVYDADGGGTIDPQEAQTLLKDMHGDDFGSDLYVARAYNKFAMLVRKNIDLEKFHQFATDYAKVFEPAVELQKKLAVSVLGTIYWFVRAKKRKQMYGSNYKHVTRVVDKVRIMREKELELDWGKGGKGNKKYMIAKKKKDKQFQVKENESRAPQNVLILDSGTTCSTSEEESDPSDHHLSSGGTLSIAKNKERGTVSFADDVKNDNDSPTSSSPVKAMMTKLNTSTAGTSKYFFGTRPNTPSKQISYFLDKFYEKPGEVKVTTESGVALTPYSLIHTGRNDKPVVISTVQSAIDSSYMVKAEKEESASAIRLAKKNKKEELMKSITDIRTYSRAQDFMKRHEPKEQEKKSVRKLTKAQTRMIKTKEKKERMALVHEAMD